MINKSENEVSLSVVESKKSYWDCPRNLSQLIDIQSASRWWNSHSPDNSLEFNHLAGRNSIKAPGWLVCCCFNDTSTPMIIEDCPLSKWFVCLLHYITRLVSDQWSPINGFELWDESRFSRMTIEVHLKWKTLLGSHSRSFTRRLWTFPNRQFIYGVSLEETVPNEMELLPVFNWKQIEWGTKHMEDDLWSQ